RCGPDTWAARLGAAGSERNVVVFETVVADRFRSLALGGGLRAARSAAFRSLAIVVAATATAAATFATTAEHLHFTADDVGAVALHAFLVGVLVRPDRAFDINLTTLLQILARDFGKTSEQLDPMPFGALLLLAGLLVFPGFGRGHTERADRRAAAGVFHFRI